MAVREDSVLGKSRARLREALKGQHVELKGDAAEQVFAAARLPNIQVTMNGGQDGLCVLLSQQNEWIGAAAPDTKDKLETFFTLLNIFVHNSHLLKRRAAEAPAEPWVSV